MTHRDGLDQRQWSFARRHKEGANVMINGMGDAAAIEAERADMAKEFAVTAVYSGAMRKPDEIHAMVKEAEAKLGSPRSMRCRRDPRHESAHWGITAIAAFNALA